MAVENTTHLDIGLSKEDQSRIEALREVRIEKRKSRVNLAIFKQINAAFANLTPIKIKDKVTFFHLLAVMINSGMPIIRSLYVLSEQLANPKFAGIVRQLAQKMEEGKSLSEAMNDYSGVFGESERGMIASGEASGNLNQILKTLAVQTEKGATLITKVKGAMIYPAAIMVVVIAAMLLILTLVVPQISSIFEESGKELPLTTQILIAASDFAQSSWYLIIVGLVAAVLGFYLFSKTKRGRYLIHYGILWIPIFGTIVKKVMVARFARMLGVLLKAGIPIVRGLEINANAMGNEIYKKRILFISQDVSQGIPIGENLSNSEWLFPPMVASMILVGEKTANIVDVSEKIADFYEMEVDTAVSSLSKLMEPVILVVMGLVVGFLVSAIMQPIIALSDVASVI